MNEVKLRSGITTGTCSAAAAKAAVMAWLGKRPNTVAVTTPRNVILTVPIEHAAVIDGGGRATVIKDAGDDPDITNGVTIAAEIKIDKTGEVVLQAGKGVGTVTKPGLAVPVGQPAINPGPRRMIIEAVKEVLPGGSGAIVTISVDGGEQLAARTLNPFLGVVGGLSIIGTTGIVEPMSEAGLKNSLVVQTSMARAQGHKWLVFVPGKIGWNAAVERYGLPADAVVQTSNFIGFMLEDAVRQGAEGILIFGHLGKIAKVSAGSFETHNRVADGRLEAIAAYAAAGGASQSAVQAILECTTAEAAIPVLAEHDCNYVYSVLCRRASERAMRYVFNDLQVGTIITDLKGTILGLDEAAGKIGGRLGWNIK